MMFENYRPRSAKKARTVRPIPTAKVIATGRTALRATLLRVDVIAHLAHQVVPQPKGKTGRALPQPLPLSYCILHLEKSAVNSLSNPEIPRTSGEGLAPVVDRHQRAIDARR